MASVPINEQPDDELRIVLTPIQLALILDGKEVHEGQMLSTRLWGGGKALLGLVEMVGAGFMLLAPEPTMLTKAGGAALGTYAVDFTQSGLRQAWTGRETETLTYEATAAASRALGAEDDIAEKIARGVDIAVPLALSVGVAACRIAAIRGGRIALIEHEAEAGSRIGGHTILKHIGKTDAELIARAQTSGALYISTFESLEIAERAVYTCIRGNKAGMIRWARTAGAGATQEFEIAFSGAGRGVARGSNIIEQMNRVRVVLKKETYNGKIYYVLTSYPLP